jgi:NhaA family Na+:H+ antiporter
MELINKIRTYSIPLIAGVIVALIAANLFPETYHHLIHAPIIGEINFHFLVNDIFMVFFFGTAGVEIVHSLSKGGALNPIQKAVAPLMATAGGVLGPIAVFFILNMIIGDPSYANGWGICTAF